MGRDGLNLIRIDNPNDCEFIDRTEIDIQQKNMFLHDSFTIDSFIRYISPDTYELCFGTFFPIRFEAKSSLYFLGGNGKWGKGVINSV
jgi:hypothetical protein